MISSKLFSTYEHKNLLICVSANYKDGSVLITDFIPSFHFNGDTQASPPPLYYYEKYKPKNKELFDKKSKEKYIRHDAISNFILERAKKQYGKNVMREDIFYYVYVFLHSKAYRETFANDFKKNATPFTISR